MKILYDPVQAIFDGVSSGIARAFLAIMAFVLAYYSYSVSQGTYGPVTLSLFPLAAFGAMFAWATTGVFFLVGLFSLIAFVVVARIFLESVEPKLLFMVLYGLSFIYFIPLMWLEHFLVWKALVTAGVFLSGYFVVAFVLPWLFLLMMARKAEKDAAQ